MTQMNELKFQELKNQFQEVNILLEKTQHELERSHRKLNHAQQELFALIDACTLINSTLDQKKLLNLIMHLAKETMSAEASCLMLLDEKTNELVFEVAHGEKGDKIKEIRVKMGQGISGWVAEHGEPLLIPDVSKDPRFYGGVDKKSEFITKSIVCAPLKTKDKIIGVVQVLNRIDGDEFDYTSLKLLTALANQSTVAIENAILYESLTQEKRKIETIVNGMADGVILADNEGNPTLLNPAAKRIFNLANATDEIMANNLKLNIFLKELETIETNTVFDIAMMKPERVILSNSVSLLKNQTNQVEEAVIVMRNITESKARERKKSEFLSLLVHKMLDPLKNVNKHFQLSKSGDEVPPIEKTIFQLSKLEKYITKLLNFSDLESGPLRLDRMHVDLMALCTKVLEKLSHSINSKNLIVNKKFPENAKPFSVDEERIEQLFEAIISNAIHFSPDNGEINIQAIEDSEGIVFSITDSGSGISNDKLLALANELHSIDFILSNNDIFSGEFYLEFAFAKHILNAHGGKIWIKSEKEVGTTFSFSLPRF